MKPFRFFEIVRRGNDRFYWRLVSVKGRRRRRRVLARSARDYRSPEKATQAIETLQSVEVIVDTTEDPFTLPTTHFRIVRGVVPLMVDEFPVEDTSEEFRVFGAARNDSPGKPTGAKGAAKAAAKPPATRARKPATRRGSRAKKAA
jgi:hypothetical protein